MTGPGPEWTLTTPFLSISDEERGRILERGGERCFFKTAPLVSTSIRNLEDPSPGLLGQLRETLERVQ